DGKPWALRKMARKAQGLVEVAVGPKCEECFSIHEDGFSHMEWDAFCQANKHDEQVKADIAAARKVHLKQEPPPTPVQEVLERTDHAIESRRSYIVLTESDLRKALQTRRLTKESTKSLYTAQVPKEGEDGWELGYWFVNPNMPYRTVDIISRTGVGRDNYIMDRDKQLWKNQGTVTCSSKSRLMHDQAGVLTILEKDKAGFMKTLDEFLESKGAKGEGVGDGADAAMPDGSAALADAAAASDDESEDAELVGRAAGPSSSPPVRLSGKSSPAQPSPSPPASHVGGPLKRLKTFGASAISDTASAAGDETQSNAGASELCMLAPTGTGALDHWKSKISLAMVMSGQVDGRTISACKKAAARMTQSEDDAVKAEAQLLNNFIKTIVTAQCLQVQNMPTCFPDDLKLYVRKMVEEDVIWPLPNMEKLLHLRLADLQKLGDMKALFDALDPFSSSVNGKFDPECPRLADIPLPMASKTKLLVHISIETLLLGMIGKGAGSQDQVKTYTTICIDKFEDVDLVCLDGPSGACISECLDAWRAVLGLVSTSLDPSLEDA
ncbi:unnamed protein product, partial [Prorocentrum cordatum]